MKGLERRLAKAQYRARAKRRTPPTDDELHWARHVEGRYVALTALRQLEHEESIRAGFPSELPPYTEEEAQFLADCTARELQRAQEIFDRYDRANGRVPLSDMTPVERERELERRRQESDRVLNELRAEIAKLEAEEEERLNSLE
jgi:hypothetical protein